MNAKSWKVTVEDVICLLSFFFLFKGFHTKVNIKQQPPKWKEVNTSMRKLKGKIQATDLNAREIFFFITFLREMGKSFPSSFLPHDFILLLLFTQNKNFSTELNLISTLSRHVKIREERSILKSFTKYCFQPAIFVTKIFINRN